MERYRLFVDLGEDQVGEMVAELLEFLARDVGDQGAEGIVQSDDIAVDAFVAGGGSFGIEPDELRNLRSNQIEIPSGGQVRADGRKDVATMKCGRDGGLNHPVLIGDFARSVQAVAVNHGGN